MMEKYTKGKTSRKERIKEDFALFQYYKEILYIIIMITLSGKKSKSVFDFLTYSRETWFSFSYEKVGHLFRAIGASDEIDRVSNLDNSLSFGAKQGSLRQIFFEVRIFQFFFM